ncbi:hypothetical protein D3C73_893530 [compost metagenome]
MIEQPVVDFRIRPVWADRAELFQIGYNGVEHFTLSCRLATKCRNTTCRGVAAGDAEPFHQNDLRSSRGRRAGSRNAGNSTTDDGDIRFISQRNATAPCDMR